MENPRAEFVVLAFPTKLLIQIIDMNSKFLIDNQRFLELEYGQIKSEILKRIELRQQLIQITLTFGGV